MLSPSEDTKNTIEYKNMIRMFDEETVKQVEKKSKILEELIDF